MHKEGLNKKKRNHYQQDDSFQDKFRIHTHIEELQAEFVKLLGSQLIQNANKAKTKQRKKNLVNLTPWHLIGTNLQKWSSLLKE